MMAPTLKGFLARQTATEKSLRRGASSPRISSVVRPKGGTFIRPGGLVDRPELGERRVDRAVLEEEVGDGARGVLDLDLEPLEGDGVEGALDLVHGHARGVAAADVEELVAGDEAGALGGALLEEAGDGAAGAAELVPEAEAGHGVGRLEGEVDDGGAGDALLHLHVDAVVEGLEVAHH